MNLRRHKVPESPQTIRRRSSLLTSDELLLKFPIDLVIEIFSRLPLKSIALCRCVSKRWSSVLRRPDFTELFFTRSSNRMRIRRRERKPVSFVSVICNPSTKQSFTLPKVNTRKGAGMRSFLGYDPVEKQYKPFCSSDPFYVHYYNYVNKAIMRVEIQGMGAFEKASRVRIFLDHAEDVKLME
ncbi:hypothetical protein F2Q68_00024673 [Brassica cretica]|uniref:F-box domain-containing protein n=1 Tax=Brassica cretica TaxID=69181 RepID=A0A8S9IAU2_BRACR|nr:hypothetical protein F2Q68_00024673 [Brassica cretica]